MKLLDRQRSGALPTSTRLEENEAEVRARARQLARLEAANKDLESKLEESEQVRRSGERRM